MQDHTLYFISIWFQRWSPQGWIGEIWTNLRESVCGFNQNSFIPYLQVVQCIILPNNTLIYQSKSLFYPSVTISTRKRSRNRGGNQQSKLEKDRQYKDQKALRKKGKQRSTQHYTENAILSKTNLHKVRGELKMIHYWSSLIALLSLVKITFIHIIAKINYYQHFSHISS